MTKKLRKILNEIMKAISIVSGFIYRTFIVIFIWYAMIEWFSTVPRLWFMMLGVVYIISPTVNELQKLWRTRTKNISEEVKEE